MKKIYLSIALILLLHGCSGSSDEQAKQLSNDIGDLSIGKIDSASNELLVATNKSKQKLNRELKSNLKNDKITSYMISGIGTLGGLVGALVSKEGDGKDIIALVVGAFSFGFGVLNIVNNSVNDNSEFVIKANEASKNFYKEKLVWNGDVNNARRSYTELLEKIDELITIGDPDYIGDLITTYGKVPK